MSSAEKMLLKKQQLEQNLSDAVEQEKAAAINRVLIFCFTNIHGFKGDQIIAKQVADTFDFIWAGFDFEAALKMGFEHMGRKLVDNAWELMDEKTRVPFKLHVAQKVADFVATELVERITKIQATARQ